VEECVIMGCKLTNKALGLGDIILKGDAGLVVRAINDKNPKWCHCGQILEDIKGILVGFRCHED
jgi:hypothetical protein